MESQQAYTPLSDRVMSLLRNRFGAYFTSYYDGAPDQIPESALPALIVDTASGSVTTDSTATDMLRETTIINIVANTKDGFGTSDDTNTVMKQLNDLVQSIDPSTGSFSDSSVLGVLRINITMDSTIIDNEMSWEYNQHQRTMADGQALSSLCEAVITITTEQRVEVPQRY